MELIELKSVWDTVVQETISKHSVDESLVTKTIKIDSRTVLTKIKRVMYFKFIFGGLTLAIGLVISTGLFVAPEKFIFLKNIFNMAENKVFILSMVVFIAGMLTANYKAFKHLQAFDNSMNIISSLKQFIEIMERTIKLNIYSSAVFNTFAITWFFYAFLSKKEFLALGTMGIILSAIASVTFILLYFLSRYEQKFKFGNHVKTLKANLESLEKEN